jgi:hypothetical protein
LSALELSVLEHRVRMVLVLFAVGAGAVGSGTLSTAGVLVLVSLALELSVLEHWVQLVLWTLELLVLDQWIYQQG